jgi:RHS repeat-associated protein
LLGTGNGLSYTYDGAGLRTVVAPSGAPGLRRYFFYSPEGQLLAETALSSEPAPPIAFEYLWVQGRPVAQVDGGAVTAWTLGDQLGTPLLQTDAAGSVLWQAEYEPYGRIFLLRTADRHQPLRLPGQEAEQLELGENGATERFYNVFRWYRFGWSRYTQPDPLDLASVRLMGNLVPALSLVTGREHDGPTGHYYRARYYHPTLQRFISEDPLGLMGGDANLYAYVFNSPIIFTDPFGLKVLNPHNYPVQKEVLDRLEAFNRYIGQDKDIVITGGDRPGDPNTHGQGLAADIKVPGQPHLQTANQAADSSLFGGVGWYEEGYRNPRDPKVGPHAHVDLRKGKFRWGYDKTGRYYQGWFPKYSACPMSGRKPNQ